jgi:hypothetical protein
MNCRRLTQVFTLVCAMQLLEPVGGNHRAAEDTRRALNAIIGEQILEQNTHAV